MFQRSKSSNPSSSNPSSPQQKSTQQPGEVWEEVMGGIGLLLIIGVVGFLLYQSWQPRRPPAMTIEVEQIVAQENGYLVQIRATNDGSMTAASAVVEGTLVDNSGNTIESSEITFDFIPPRSTRRGGLVFQANPHDYPLELQFRGYIEP